jgi:hypothetical protein
VAATNPDVLAELRAKLGNVSNQAISQRRARISKLVAMPTDIATYVVAHRAGVRLNKHLDSETLERVAAFEGQLAAKEGGQTAARATGSKPRSPAKPREVKLGANVPADSLSPKHMLDAARMAEVYPLLYAFENSMREFIDGHLTAAFGEKWHDDPKIVSTQIKGRVERNRNAEAKNRYHSRRNVRFIYYTDLGDLPLIAHSQNGWKVFGPLFPSDKWLHGRVEVIEASRNVVAHMNPLAKRDIERIRINFEDWLDQIKGNRPSAAP